MTWEKYGSFWDYKIGYSMDGPTLAFCIDSGSKAIGFTSATVPNLDTFLCILDRPKVTGLEDGTFEIRIPFCHSYPGEDDMTSYVYWHDIYLFDPETFDVKFREHELIPDPKEDPRNYGWNDDDGEFEDDEAVTENGGSEENEPNEDNE